MFKSLKRIFVVSFFSFLSSFSVAHGAIRVLSAIYGPKPSVDGKGQDLMSLVRESCQGRLVCDFHLKVFELSPEQSQLVVRYVCADATDERKAFVGPEASGLTIRLSCEEDSGRGVRVQNATYGYNVGEVPSNNALNHATATCNGLHECYYQVSAAHLGDPAPGQEKAFRIEYDCHNDAPSKTAILAGEANLRTVALLCPPSPAVEAAADPSCSRATLLRRGMIGLGVGGTVSAAVLALMFNCRKK